MAHADDMIDITQSEFQELISQDTSSICEAEQGVICEDRTKTHRSCM